MTARIFVTGATDWTDTEMVEDVLDHVAVRFTEAGFARREIVLVTGTSPGAEATATNSWYPFPIEWSIPSKKQHGKSAPYIRNYKVIQSSPELVLIFGQSKHSDHALQLARAADIETVHIE